MITTCCNPFALVRHNRFQPFGIERWPRAFFQLVHLAVGLPALAVYVLAPAQYHPTATAFILCAVLAVVNKSVWIQWPEHRVSWTGLHVENWPDFFADFAVTCLALALPSLRLGWWHVLAFAVSAYVCSVFQDPYP